MILRSAPYKDYNPKEAYISGEFIDILPIEKNYMKCGEIDGSILIGNSDPVLFCCQLITLRGFKVFWEERLFYVCIKQFYLRVRG